MAGRHVTVGISYLQIRLNPVDASLKGFRKIREKTRRLVDENQLVNHGYHIEPAKPKGKIEASSGFCDLDQTNRQKTKTDL